jgi:hypothetical protein
MDAQRFDAIVLDQLNSIKKVLASKNKEYGIGDRLHNFKVAARIANSTPERALHGMMMKHLVSVFDMVDACENDCIKLTMPLIEEKCTDLVNYVILLKALLIERVEKSAGY